MKKLMTLLISVMICAGAFAQTGRNRAATLRQLQAYAGTNTAAIAVLENNKVPYTGASGDVDLGSYNISAATPAQDGHLTTKLYVDTATSANVETLWSADGLYSATIAADGSVTVATLKHYRITYDDNVYDALLRFPPQASPILVPYSTTDDISYATVTDNDNIWTIQLDKDGNTVDSAVTANSGGGGWYNVLEPDPWPGTLSAQDGAYGYLTVTLVDAVTEVLATTAYVDAAVEDKVASDTISIIWTGTQAEYDALTPDADTLYFIEEE